MKSNKAEVDPFPYIIDTFRRVGAWEEGTLRQNKPSVWNGVVYVEKYRVTITRVDEPKEVIHARLQELWDECDNHHHWDPLRVAAKKFGYELQGEPGSKRKRRTT